MNLLSVQPPMQPISIKFQPHFFWQLSSSWKWNYKPADESLFQTM